MEALFTRAARLTKVDFAEPPSAIGKTTEQALQSGLVYDFAGQVDRIVEEIGASSAPRLAPVAVMRTFNNRYFFSDRVDPRSLRYHSAYSDWSIPALALK